MPLTIRSGLRAGDGACPSSAYGMLVVSLPGADCFASARRSVSSSIPDARAKPGGFFRKQRVRRRLSSLAGLAELALSTLGLLEEDKKEKYGRTICDAVR